MWVEPPLVEQIFIIESARWLLLHCTMCTLCSIFFRATEQAQTYLKFEKILSSSTYICPSLFECAENTLF